MPLTWFAHQVPMLGMKLGRPKWLDATALCLGSMMPDLLYAVSGYFGFDTHRSPVTFLAGVPTVVILAVLVRRVLAPVGPAHFPDLGSFQLRSWAVIATRRPPLLVTAGSAFLGIGSHIVIDWFTHPGRPGERWLGYDDVQVTVLGVTEPVTEVLQVLGHTVGSFVGIWMLWLIGRRGLLDDWYGTGAVVEARRWRPKTAQRVIFTGSIAVSAIGGLMWGVNGEPIEFIQRTFVGALIGAVVGAALIRPRDRPPRSATQVIKLRRRP